MPPARWRYSHSDLGEAVLPDGQSILRPVVTVSVASSAIEYVAVVDSGSPISIADSGLFARFGIDPAIDQPLFEVPLGMGGAFGRIPVFAVELELRPPRGVLAPPVIWSLQLGARHDWRLPFSVLLGQRGWFDQFPTTIDGASTTVHVDAPPS